MTQIKRVSKAQMERKTGFKTALGYSLPKEDTILIRKGLPKKVEEKVLKHEEEHIAKGEEGPLLGALIGAGASILGGIMGSRSAGKAADAQVDASRQQIEFARESRDMARQDAAPYREAGYTALDALMSLTGLGGGPKATSSQPRGGLRRNVMATDYLRGLGVGARGRMALRYGGGPISRYGGGPMYNINELEPESRYEGGSYTRNSKPQTIRPAGDGYIQPRVFGGNIGYAPTMRRFLENKPAPHTPLNTQNTPSVIDNNTGAVTSLPARENPGGVEGGYNFMTDPGYEFRRSEGMRALERGGAAAGGLLSGGYARRAIRYGQDYASNEYTNVYNRIANIAGLGQVSAGQSGQAALYGGAQMGAAAGNAGAARASGYTAQGNAWQNTIQELGKLPWEDIFNRDSA